MIDANISTKLQKIEALYEGAKTLGERESAFNAKKRLVKKIYQNKTTSTYRFTIQDKQSAEKLIRILKQYDIKGSKRRRTDETTVLAKISSDLIDNVIWPEYIKATCN